MSKLEKKLILITLIFSTGTIYFINGCFLIDLIGEQKLIETIPASLQVSKNLPEEQKSITLIFVGDIMLNRGVEYMVEKWGDGDFKFPFLKIADELQKTDVLFGNLEGPISDKGVKVGSIYSFRAEPKAIEGLTFSGFDMISVSNNHAFDYGKEAFEDTLLRLREGGINYVGGGFDEAEAYSPVIKEINGTKIAFLAYTNLGSPNWAATEQKSGIAWVDWNNFEKIKNDIKKAKENSDVLIVSLHSGEEYTLEPTQFQIEFSHAAINAGADLVVGHHTHIIQQTEKYRDGYIFYSLGNFVFDQGFSEETRQGQIIKVSIENNKIKEIIPTNIKLNQYFQPEIE